MTLVCNRIKNRSKKMSLVGAILISMSFGVCNAQTSSSQLIPEVPPVKMRDAKAKFIIYKYSVEIDTNGVSGPVSRIQVCKQTFPVPVYDVRGATMSAHSSNSNCHTKLNGKEGFVQVGSKIEISSADPFQEGKQVVYKTFTASSNFFEIFENPMPIPVPQSFIGQSTGTVIYGNAYVQESVQTKDLKLQTVGIDLGGFASNYYKSYELPMPYPEFKQEKNIRYCGGMDPIPGPIFPCQIEYIISFVEFDDSTVSVN